LPDKFSSPQANQVGVGLFRVAAAPSRRAKPNRTKCGRARSQRRAQCAPFCPQCPAPPAAAARAILLPQNPKKTAARFPYKVGGVAKCHFPMIVNLFPPDCNQPGNRSRPTPPRGARWGGPGRVVAPRLRWQLAKQRLAPDARPPRNFSRRPLRSENNARLADCRAPARWSGFFRWPPASLAGHFVPAGPGVPRGPPRSPPPAGAKRPLWDGAPHTPSRSIPWGVPGFVARPSSRATRIRRPCWPPPARRPAFFNGPWFSGKIPAETPPARLFWPSSPAARLDGPEARPRQSRTAVADCLNHRGRVCSPPPCPSAGRAPNRGCPESSKFVDCARNRRPANEGLAESFSFPSPEAGPVPLPPAGAASRPVPVPPPVTSHPPPPKTRRRAPPGTRWGRGWNLRRSG